MRRSASEAQDEICIVMSLRWESDCDVQLDIKPLPTNLKFVPGFVEKGLKSALTFQPGISRLKVRPKHHVSFWCRIGTSGRLLLMQAALFSHAHSISPGQCCNLHSSQSHEQEQQGGSSHRVDKAKLTRATASDPDSSIHLCPALA